MPDVYEVPLPISFHVAGALAAGTTALRKVIPFDHEVIGVSACVGTAPAGGPTLFDILHGATGTTAANCTTLWPTNPGNRPSIAAGALDHAAATAGTTTVTPEGTDPALSGQTSGVSTTYTNYNELPFLARPDVPTAPAAGYGAASATGDNPGEPFNEPGMSENALGTPGWPAVSPNTAFRGAGGDVYYLAVVAGTGNTGLGSDAEVTLWVIPR